MNKKEFNENVEFLLKEAHNTLITKNAKYANEDALHNFKAGAEISGQTPERTCWGYMTKHLTALRDMLDKEELDKEDLLEKVQDSINYLIFTYCLLLEKDKEQRSKFKIDFEKNNDSAKRLSGKAEVL